MAGRHQVALVKARTVVTILCLAMSAAQELAAGSRGVALSLALAGGKSASAGRPDFLPDLLEGTR